MTMPAPFLRRDPLRLRHLAVGIVVALAAAALLMQALWDVVSFAAGVALMIAYGVAPLLHVALVWLLFELLAKARPLVVGAPPRFVVRGVQVAYLYSILGPAVVGAVVCVMRIHYRVQPPASGTYLSEPWGSLLNDFLSAPAYRIALLSWVAFVLVTLLIAFRLRPGSIRIPESTMVSARAASEVTESAAQ
jgi:hypothetical protein